MKGRSGSYRCPFLLGGGEGGTAHPGHRYARPPLPREGRNPSCRFAAVLPANKGRLIACGRDGGAGGFGTRPYGVNGRDFPKSGVGVWEKR